MIQEVIESGQIFTPITWILILVVTFFLKKTLTDLESDIKHISNNYSKLSEKFTLLASSMTGMQTEFNTFKRDLETALIAAKQVDILKEKLAVHQRNEQTMWKHIDQLKVEIKRVHEDFSRFGGLIAEFRRQSIRDAKDGT